METQKKCYMDIQTESEIPWAMTADLGAGVAVPSGELLQSAVEPFTVVPGDERSEKFDVEIVENREDIKKLLSAEVRAGFNTASVSTSANTHFMDSLSVSERSSTVVCQGRIVWGQALASPLPRLTAEALELYENNPHEFHRAHGQYFIAGFTKEAKLSIFARVRGSSKESVRKISEELKVGFRTLGFEADADFATKIENSAMSNKCDIELDILKTGISDDKDLNPLGITMREVPEHIKDFQERAIGTKTTALLIHYNRLEPKISTRSDVDAEMFNMANRFFEDLMLAKVLKKGLPKHYANDMEERLKAIEDDYLKYVPRDLSGDIGRLHDIRDRIENWISDADELERYRHLWQQVEAAPGKSTGSKWGVTSWEDPELRDLSIETKSDSRRQPYTTPGWQRGNLPIEVPHRKICGIELKANKGHNGNHTLVDGGLKKDFVKFAFKSEYDRGFNWTAKVWSVPEKMADFGSEDL